MAEMRKTAVNTRAERKAANQQSLEDESRRAHRGAIHNAIPKVVDALDAEIPYRAGESIKGVIDRNSTARKATAISSVRGAKIAAAKAKKKPMTNSEYVDQRFGGK